MSDILDNLHCISLEKKKNNFSEFASVSVIRSKGEYEITGPGLVIYNSFR